MPRLSGATGLERARSFDARGGPQMDVPFGGSGGVSTPKSARSRGAGRAKAGPDFSTKESNRTRDVFIFIEALANAGFVHHGDEHASAGDRGLLRVAQRRQLDLAADKASLVGQRVRVGQPLRCRSLGIGTSSMQRGRGWAGCRCRIC
jgi:hypothetical protein